MFTACGVDGESASSAGEVISTRFHGSVRSLDPSKTNRQSELMGEETARGGGVRRCRQPADLVLADVVDALIQPALREPFDDDHGPRQRPSGKRLRSGL